MATYRDIYLIMRARDEASRTIRNVGSTFDTLGKKQRQITQEYQNRLEAIKSSQQEFARGTKRHFGEITSSRRADIRSLQEQRAEHTLTNKRINRQLEEHRQGLRRLSSRQIGSMRLTRARNEEAIAGFDKQVRGLNNLNAVDEQTSKQRIRRSEDVSRRLAARADRIRAAQQATLDSQQRLIGGMQSAGQAALLMGATFAIVGGIVTHRFLDMASSAMEFQEQSRIAYTVSKDLEGGIHDIGDAVLDVARQVPAPIEGLQKTIYRIFSALEFSLEDSKELLKGFAKEAVVGNADIEAAARSTIAMMNAFRLTTEDLTRVQDMQFNTVRWGNLTYEELSATIGKVIPSAVRLEQEIETIGTSMAFMTRQGLSASMSATAAARAMELFSHPKTVSRLDEMGLSITDTTGRFKPLNEIINILAESMRGLPAAEVSAKMQEIFQGTNYRIQARRFIDLAIKNADEFTRIHMRMIEDVGSFERAYRVAMEQPQHAADLLTNKTEALSITIGQELIPVKLRLIEIATGLIDKWDSLDESTKGSIVRFVAFGAAITAISGVLIALGGLFLLVASQVSQLVIALGLATGKMAILKYTMAIMLGGPAGIFGVVAGLALLIHHWDDVTAAIKGVIDWWNSLHGVQQFAIVLLASVTAGLIATTGAFNGAAIAVGRFVLALKAIAVANPILLALTAAAAALMGVFGELTRHSREVSAASREYGSALADNMQQLYQTTQSTEELSAAIDKLTRKQVMQRLEQQGVMEQARDLGLSMKVVTDAAMGDADARAKVNQVTDEAIGLNHGLARGIKAITPWQTTQAEKAMDVADAVHAQSEAVGKSIELYHEEAEAIGGVDAKISQLIKYQQQGGPLNRTQRAHQLMLQAQVQEYGGLAAAVEKSGVELSQQEKELLANSGAMEELGEETEETKKWFDQFAPAVQEAFAALGEGFDVMSAYQERLGEMNEAAQESSRKRAESENESIQSQIDAVKERADVAISTYRNERSALDDAEVKKTASYKNQTDAAIREMERERDAKIKTLEEQEAADDKYYEEIKANFGAYMESLEQTLKDQAEWHANLNKIREMGLDEYANMLAARGPEAAGLVAEIASQERDAIKKASDMEMELRKQSYETAIQLTTEKYGSIVEATGEYNREAVEELAEQLGVLPPTVEGILNESEAVTTEKLEAMVRSFDATSAESAGLFISNLEQMPPEVQAKLGESEKFAETFGAKFVEMFDQSGLEGVSDFLKHTADLPPDLRRNILQSQAVTEGFYKEFKGLLKDAGRDGRIEMLTEMDKTPGMIDTLFSEDMIPTIKGQLEAMESLAGTKGRDIVANLVEKLGLGVTQVSGITTAYAKVLAQGLNPVIKEIGGEVIVHAASDTPQQILQDIGVLKSWGVPGLAEGKLPDQALIQNAQEGLVQWAEPETGGEAFIPLSPGKRQRSIQIWEETGRRLGIDPEPTAKFQSGGFNSPSDIPVNPKLTAEFPFGKAVAATANQRMEDLYKKSQAWLTTALMPAIGGGADIGAAPGVQKMMGMLHTRFPGLPLISGLRPGAITATGNPSWHAKGRAVDIPPRMDVFNHIRSMWGAQALELIFSPAGGRQLHRGKPHMYSGITRSNHWDHIHWAMQNGGLLPGRGGGDTVPAMLEPGEFVMRKEAVDRIGPENLDRMNFQGGGRVPSAEMMRMPWDDLSRIQKQFMNAFVSSDFIDRAGKALGEGAGKALEELMETGDFTREIGRSTHPHIAEDAAITVGALNRRQWSRDSGVKARVSRGNPLIEQLIRDSMQEVLPTRGEPGLGTLAGDQLSDIRGAIQAAQAEVEAAAGLDRARQEVVDLRTELNLVTQQIGQYQGRFNELQEMGRVISDESQLNWMQAKQRVRELRAEVEQMKNPVRTIAQELELIAAKESVKELRTELSRIRDIGIGGMAAEDELGILRQRDRVDELAASLRELRDPQIDTQAVEDAQTRLAEAQAAYETAQASVAQQRTSVGAARAEIARVEQIVPALDNEVAALLMRYEAEAKLTDAQHALAEAEEEALTRRNEVKSAEEALAEARKTTEVTDRQLRIAELELRLARDELTQSTREARISSTDLRIADLELAQAQERLNEQMNFGQLETGELRMKQLELNIAERESLEARRNLADFTPEYYELEEKLEGLKEKRVETEKAFYAAQEAVTTAQWANMDAILGVMSASQELNGLQPESVAYFHNIANAAGFSKQEIDALTGSVMELNEANLALSRATQANMGGTGRDERIARFGSTAEIRQRIARIFRNRGVAYSYGLRSGESAEERFQRLIREVMGGRSFDSIRRSVGIMASNIHGLQYGGIARARRGGTIVNVGEAGQDEAIVPLPQNWRQQDGLGKTEIKVEDGAFQFNFNGPVTEDVMPELEEKIDESLDKFLKELRGDWRSR